MNILRTTVIAACALALAPAFFAPARAADASGTWLTEDKKAKVKIASCGDAICGTLVWLSEPIDPDTKQPKTDKHNADVGKQSRPLLGIPIVLGMKPSGEGTWEGKVYNAEDGGTYTGSFALTGANTANLKGCVMGGLICKTAAWTRSN